MQTIIRQHPALAVYTRCSSHCSNLAMIINLARTTELIAFLGNFANRTARLEDAVSIQREDNGFKNVV